ncbi:MAG: exodeoxyribonuclease VII large subunit [Deltaproteobacteria bacterium]|jgi:exodeoxyribonuclease VII large subunit|nr:exodeoxyribonuclease VII large subunit [Deltaproteobacteria bacterium]
MSRVYQVSELTAAIRGLLEGHFPFVWVRGQIFNLSCPSSGHIYFSLKDEDSSLAAVWFKGNQQDGESFDPLTGEVFEDGPRPSLAQRLREEGAGSAGGLEVVCAGRLGVYPPRGSYQLVVEIMQEAGKGRLQIEFEKLKAELAAKGYFDPQRKRPLPGGRGGPSRVAVITSPSGAAIHDFLRIAGSRGLSAQIRIYPTLVQGEGAPAMIATALEQASTDGWAEVIVLIRGGGSLEDLWAFNSREVSQAVFASRVPVLSGVGHEVDVTLTDMVADVRAATPSHAAQLLWPERRELAQRLDELELALSGAWRRQLLRCESLLTGQEKILRLLAPSARLERHAYELQTAEERLSRAIRARQEALLRGLDLAAAAFAPLGERLIRSRMDVVDKLDLRLAGLDPHLPLRRGYAFVKKADGGILRGSGGLVPGERLDLCLVDGQVPVVVIERD